MTTSLSAYNGDAMLRAALAERLKSHIRDSRLKPGPIAWDGEKGSMIGCILESDDLYDWETGLGLPQWLAVLIDALAANQPSTEEAAAFGIATLEAIPPGADVRLAGSQIILDVLDDLEHAGAAALAAPIADSLVEVRALHLRCVGGDVPGSAEWRLARKAATAATDGAIGPRQRAFGRCIETAAWNPAQSHSAVFDTLRVWRNARCEQVLLDFGWDKIADAALNARCKELYDRYVKDQPDPKSNVMQLLAEHHPDESARLREKSRLETEAIADTAQRTTAMLNQALRAA